MTPTVGRIVHVFLNGNIKEQPLAGIITRVWSPTCVNVAVFGPDGKPHMGPPTSLALLEPGQGPPAGDNSHFCVWPPQGPGVTADQKKLEDAPGGSTIILDPTAANPAGSTSPPA